MKNLRNNHVPGKRVGIMLVEVKILFTTQTLNKFFLLSHCLYDFFGLFALELVNNVVKCSALRFAIQARVKKNYFNLFECFTSSKTYFHATRVLPSAFHINFHPFLFFSIFIFSAYIYIIKLSRYDFTCESCE